jgi:hypothetical protein
MQWGRDSLEFGEGVRVMLLHEFNWKREMLESKEPVLVDFWAA